MKVAHIGFGKTATTTLQNFIFPTLANSHSIQYLRSDDFRVRTHMAGMYLDKKINHMELPEKYLLSAEELHGWDPYLWEQYADKNLEFLGKDCHIILTIREPKGYLSSVYLQHCMHEGNVQKSKDYFLNENLYSPYLSSVKFAIDQFSYEKIITIYMERFDKLTVVKYESLGSMDFLKEIFNCDDDINLYRNLFIQNKVNVSYSQRSVEWTLVFQEFLESLGFSLRSSEISNSLLYIKTLREDGCKTSRHIDADVSGKKSFILKALQYFKWRGLMHRMDRYFPDQKFKLDFEKLPQINLNKLVEEYSSLPNKLSK